MKTSKAFLFLPASLLMLAFNTATALADTESNLEKSYDVKPGETLVVDVDVGSIDVKPTTTSKVAIHVYRKTDDSGSAAEKLFAAHKVTFEQQAGRVTVRARMDESARSLFRRNRQLNVRFEIEIPTSFNVDLHSASGSIRVADLDGQALLDSASGSLSLGEITGEVKARTASGSVRLVGSKAVANLRSASGSIYVDKAGAALHAETASGSIQVGSVEGPARLETLSGSIRVEKAADSLEASTASGSVTAALTKQPSGDCRLESKSGSVEVQLAEGLQFDVEARTSVGRVRSDIPIQATILGDQPRGEVRGKIGDGGKRLVLQTAAGNVDIRKY